MSKQESESPFLILNPAPRDLGEFSVRRVLPAAQRRAVGPFVFFDHMGPAEFGPGAGIQVRPHPHIGLATITYLFDGEIIHRDSLGITQAIRPGAVNLMTAGKGVVHSERAGDDFESRSTLHGIQTWVGLPDNKEEMAAGFEHYAADSLPEVTVTGTSVRVICGTAYGAHSPVICHSPTLYLHVEMPAGASLALPTDNAEIGVYLVSGKCTLNSQQLDAGTMAVTDSSNGSKSDAPVIDATSDCRIMVAGGEPLGKRHVYWNFVSSSRERIEQAKSDWRAGNFAMVEGDDEFIPLPD